jgi:hypothetical protein
MADYKPMLWDVIMSKIDPDDVYNDESGTLGLEDKPHVTILYGFHETIRPKHIEKTVKPLRPIPMKVVDLSYFESEDYDVLKFDIEGNYLRSLNEAYAKFPHTTDYPEYHPHMTVAYLKKGTANKYGKLARYMEPKLLCKKLRFTCPHDDKEHIYRL